MSLKHWIFLIVGVLLLIGVVMAGSAYLGAREDKIKLQATLDAQGQLQKQYQASVDALAKQMAERDATYQAEIQSLNTRFAQAVTPDQIARLATQLMGLRSPIQVVTPPATPQNPNPTPVAQIAETDFPVAKIYLNECEQCKMEREKLIADATDRKVQADLAQKTIDSLKTDLNTATTAAKGGPFWSRLKRSAKWFVIGAAGGAVAICGTGHCKL